MGKQEYINSTLSIIQAVSYSDPLFSDEFRLVYQWVCFAVICQIIDIFGTVSNTINVICFLKQGLRDSVNVSLLGLAVSDLGSLVTLIWLNICYTPAFQEADLPFDPVSILYLTAGWPHVIFTRVTSWITAFITLERCLCIVMPLKVKGLCTPRRVNIIIASIFIVLAGSVSPMFCVNSFAMVFQQGSNKTILGLVHSENGISVEKVSVTINNVILPFGSFAVVIACTAILVVKLQRKTKWRRSATSDKSDNLMSRDQRVSRMIVIISTVFIICFTPSCVTFLATTMETRLAIDGEFRNTFIVIFGFGFVLESANSAVNIFVYYNMSSKYRTTFRQIFRLRSDRQQKEKVVNASLSV